MPKKIIYEDDPWPDVKGRDIQDFKVIKSFLPPPEVLRKAKIYIDGKLVSRSELRRQAKKNRG